MQLSNKLNRNYNLFLSLTILSTFLAGIKIYTVLFSINIIFFIYLVYKKSIRLKKLNWEKYILYFIGWTILNVIISLFYKANIDYKSFIKILLNLSFLFCTAQMIENKILSIDKKSLIRLLQIILLLNFVQVMWIYFEGGLFNDFLNGSLTSSSDSAYVIGNYNNIIGGENKNIWASKLTLIYLIYTYISCNKNFYIKIREKIFFLIIGAITIILLLSRTSQLAIIAPIIFLIFNQIRKMEYKYRKKIYLISGILSVVCLIVFFDKFFHLKFDMSDGGFTRLVIWKESILNLFESKMIIGNGIGSSGEFVTSQLMRTESNLHNVILNTFFELGLVGIIIYLSMIGSFIKNYFNKRNIFKAIFIFAIPSLIIFNLQYLGYDNDMVIFMLFIIIVNNLCEDKKVNF